ncbi:hypothetical protein TWF730_008747 [Orbilia blumenaviensis]|uniref:Ubiquitin-like-conjugating enzyme ATG10 n=1 Tax=Orbilia blumenaviensis TaxID=1796055 RepID=A0AAV9V5M3_9PEZI
MSTMSSQSLPFLSKDAFATAIEHLAHHIDTYSPYLSYEIKTSAFDKEDLYIEITRTISSETGQATSQNGDEDGDFNAEIEEDEEDDDDPEEFIRPLSTPTHRVTYSITLSPIYSVPILHFSINTPPPTPPTPVSLDDVYELLVPPSKREEVRGLGVQGGISQCEHPYTGKVVWFIHPCRTGDVLREFGEGLTIERYLSIWIGVFGGVAGLVL